MKSKQASLVIILISLLFIFSLSLYYSQNLEFRPEKFDYNLVYNNALKSSVISEKIHITGNIGWSDAKTAGICTGSGTHSDPYIIENLEIDAENNGSCIVIEDSNVYFKIQNCTLFGGRTSHPFDKGVELINVTKGELTFIQSFTNYHGILLIECHNIFVAENKVTNNLVGIELYGGANNTLLQNNASHNSVAGISLGYSYKNNISDNILSNNYRGFSINVVHMNTISNNNIINNRYGISLIGGENNIFLNNNVSYNNDYGIYFEGGDNSILSSNFLSHNGEYGIFIDGNDFHGGNNNVISDNTIKNNHYGIKLSKSHYSTLLGNNISYSGGDGIFLSSCDFNTIVKNKILKNNDNGISLDRSDSNTISENIISYNMNSGITLYECNFSSLLRNIISENNLAGVYLLESRNNIIERNLISNQQIGIYEENTYYKKFFIEFTPEINQISNNIFIGNNQNVQIVTHFIQHRLEPVVLLILTSLSIATCVIVFSSITVELIRKIKYPRGDEKYQPSVNGIRAIAIESLGVLVFILCTLFLIPIIYIYPSLFMLTAFSIGGLIYSIKGLKKDGKKSLAGIGLGFGIFLSILGSIWVLYNLIIIIYFGFGNFTGSID
jgi:parallel beta-helix repeat protein